MLGPRRAVSSNAALDSTLVLVPVRRSSSQLARRFARSEMPHSTYDAARKASATEWSIPLSSSDATSSTPAAVATASSAYVEAAVAASVISHADHARRPGAAGR